MSTDTTTATTAASIVASYSTNEKTGQLKANLVPLLEAEVSAGYDALRIRTLEVAEESPCAEVLDKAEALLAEARPACRKIAMAALTEAGFTVATLDIPLSGIAESSGKSAAEALAALNAIPSP